MTTVDISIIKEINAMHGQAKKLAGDGDLAGAEAAHVAAFDLLPEPRMQTNYTRMALYPLVKFFRDTERFDEAKSRMQELLDSGIVKDFDAEPHFILGTVYLTAGEPEAARELFEKANSLSEGRCFEGEDPKYLEFLNGR